MDLYPLSLLVFLVMGFTRKHLQVNSVTGDVSKVPHQFIGSKWDTDKSSNHYGILVSSVPISECALIPPLQPARLKLWQINVFVLVSVISTLNLTIGGVNEKKSFSVLLHPW